ncbi:MAG: hypothetical protein M0Z57_01805 [Deltaproteobacteria bacterium]|jgi:DNA invertase Pin-like site-specific DNA recombinase|nr:hypothetical protein [Deltaproteobacteria bacterium]
MENQKKILLRINRGEIFFSCEGYSEEFINAISDVINQRRQSLIESSSTSKLEELPNAGEIENKKTETIGAFGIDTNKAEKIKKSTCAKAEKQGKRYHKTYEQGEKERIIEDVRNEFSFEEINKKYNIGKATYYRIKKDIEAEIAADKSSKDSETKISTANNGSIKHRKVGFNPTSVSEEDKLNIAEDIKLGLLSSQILKKYHINIHAYSEIKKSIKMEKQKSATDEDDIESVKKRLDYGQSFDGDYSEVSVSKVDINKVQEKIHEKPLGPLAVNPGVRDWQKDMIARGL